MSENASIPGATTRTIVTYPDPVLACRAAEVGEVTPQIRQLALDMAETMYASEGIGLAAPQVGESVRLVVVDITGPTLRGGLITLVDPVVTPAGDEVVETEEGCLSVPGTTIKVRRPAAITVTGRDLDGEAVSIEADGLLAVCLQHEVDHLEGTLILDHASRLKRSLYEKKVKKWQRQENPSA
jgi:peptide deformylase